MSNVFSVPLTRILQESVNSGKNPKVWKDARVKPLFKTGENLIQAIVALLASHQLFVSARQLSGHKYLNI